MISTKNSEPPEHVCKNTSKVIVPMITIMHYQTYIGPPGQGPDYKKR